MEPCFILFPRLIAAAEWRDLERGLEQRVTALNRFLADVYSGSCSAVAAGVVPQWLLTSSKGFERNAFGIDVPHGAHCMIAGIDLVRGADGSYAVLEDNLRNPSGISYVLENRAALSKAFPALFDDHIVQPVEQYGRMLRSTLESVALDGRNISTMSRQLRWARSGIRTDSFGSPTRTICGCAPTRSKRWSA